MTMTSGLQQETAGRGTIAIYVQVSIIIISPFESDRLLMYRYSDYLFSHL